MRLRALCLFLAFAANLAPAAARDTKRCPPDFSVEHRLDAEQKAALNLNARERAAIADLRSVTMAPIREKYDKREIDRDEYNRLTKQRDDALDCIEADNNLKDQQSYYTEQTKLIEAGCRTGPVDKMYAGWLKEGDERKAKACAKADLEYLAQTVKRLKEIQADKLAKEEKSTPAVKTADASQKNAPFCDQIRAVKSHAANLFAGITKEKREKWFIEPGTLGSKGVKISDMAAIDEYATPIAVSQDFLASRAECSIEVGTEKNIALRIVPTYACDWQYDKTNRRELEERTDRLLNLVRGCFVSTTEAGEFYRHQFVGDDAVDVSGDLYYGEGKPSRIYLKIAKHTPTEDRACIDYSFQRKEQDRRLCMSRLKP
ncbi:hypothetical protein XH89_30905 [Bradyrhizobium sp. CCBAU 53340]|uniref:hypothetical protein n=1 Tax=Bradyrhizobium sp. CCBAU 53340 TaxID=1325112 RepID=UPI00188C6824|nr:hypothetical protein [Bradyrhizobium sp. CCBAU 53340]QOZ47408.1 hypothetical protein XH89_30905 [Bradyrhizobium sp. CCBAU 53340]